MKNQNGIALILTMWLIIVLTVMVAELANLMRVESNVVINFKEDAQAYSIAENGVTVAINSLLMDESRNYDSLKDLWAEKIFQESEIGSFTVQIIDEERKLNINEIDPSVLKEFLKIFAPLKCDELTENIIDFKDANFKKWNGDPEEESNKNLLFDTIYELQSVKGIVSDEKNIFYDIKDYITVTGKINLNMVDSLTLATLMYEVERDTLELSPLKWEKKIEEYEQMADKAIDSRKAKNKGEGARAYDIATLAAVIGEEHYDRIKPYITCSGKINVNTASREVLYAYFLGVLGADSKHFADEIISVRQQSPFKTFQEMDDRIADFKIIKTANDYIPVREYFTIKSSLFTIESIGHLKGSPFTKKITAIVERQEKGGKFEVKILSWHAS